MKLRVTTIGNSAGVIFPKELLARLRLQKGDELYVVETADGIRLSPYDPQLAAWQSSPKCAVNLLPLDR